MSGGGARAASFALYSLPFREELEREEDREPEFESPGYGQCLSSDCPAGGAKEEPGGIGTGSEEIPLRDIEQRYIGFDHSPRSECS